MNTQTVTASAEIRSLDNPREWQIINDGVMGGLSYGRVELERGELNFTGKISLRNNGGFSSTYLELDRQPSQKTRVRIAVEGDGKDYQLRLRSQIERYSLAYKVEFPTRAGEVLELEFDLAEFQGTFRGRIVSQAPQLTGESITHVGFLIAPGAAGAFNLTIHSIEFI
ncbi:CIA30 family protein [Paraferrimonas sedimenticola]|uniref:Exonuclease n=1 Tax=Paraferrimonas sedimenticola TaxID=375674 RepID=A0AA37RX49_9GAMM|nr:CIA30 family protein [Paraferrimonas sedimenticola]GLP96979.1 exonuclease [Paraferrimonas sedimenticola]